MADPRPLHGQSSGDLIADRRYGYGQMLMTERDFPAAVELFEQTLELVPSWAAGWFALGDAHEQAGDKDTAIQSFGKALSLSPDDALGAGLRLARLGAGRSSEAISPDYIAALFDQYADRFDDHLVTSLNYCGPQIIMMALQAVCLSQQREFRFSSVLDLGCGTGLMARAIADHAGHIDGIDLSPAMVGVAQRSGLYRAAQLGDVVEGLTPTLNPYSLILAADVFVYIGDLMLLFTRATAALEPGGFFAFTVQSYAGKGFTLGADLRYHHSQRYLLECAGKSGLQVLHLQNCVTRQDAGKPVPGFVVVIAKAGMIYGD